MKELSNRHIAFIDEYMVNGRNATRAYQVVYPNATLRSCQENGHRLLKKAEVKAEVEKREAEIRDKNKIKLEDLTNKLMLLYHSTHATHPATALGALKLLGEWHGVAKENEEENSTGPIDINVNIIKKKKENDES